MFKEPLLRLTRAALLLHLGCGDDTSSDAFSVDEKADAGPSSSAGRSSIKHADDNTAGGRAGSGRAGAAGAQDTGSRDAAVSGEDAGTSDEFVSRPGQHRGYGDKLYDVFVLWS